MRESICSGQNKLVKLVKALHNKKHRDQEGLYLIEGYKLIDEAMNYRKDICALLFHEDAFLQQEGRVLADLADKAGIAVSVLEGKLYKELSQMDSPQGVMAILKKQEAAMEALLNREGFLVMILDEVRDPGNVGTIIRTADACGIGAVMMSKGSVDLYNSKTIRATMGSMFHIPVFTEVDILKLIPRLKDMGTAVLGADPHSKQSCITSSRGARTAIVIGNEANGLRPEVKELTTQNITIPMPGKAESLNAGIAAAILMYEFGVRK
jgi:TrmH family RNA methyltransferase